MIAEIKNSIERLNNQLNINEVESNGVEYKLAENIPNHEEPKEWKTPRLRYIVKRS